MDELRPDDVLDIVASGKTNKTKLKKLGISETEFKQFMDALVPTDKKDKYHRILAEDEKRVLTPDAFGYLIHLFAIKSIDKNMFERIMTVSMQLNLFLKRKIDKSIMDEIVNYIIFSGEKDISLKELLDVFFGLESDIQFEEDVN
ncbi:MAG: hypothetical protein Q7J16_01790 [Candidatus Cloacimonadales bacterium]|nr:hypothetical protein [Candidatus Cloacimonadales bacterium]